MQASFLSSYELGSPHPPFRHKTIGMQQTMQVVLMKALNSGEKWTCTECDYKHKRRGYLLNHIEREHMTEDFPGYACLRCQQVRQSEMSEIIFYSKFSGLTIVERSKAVFKNISLLYSKHYIFLPRSWWPVMRSTST